jgi:hypothetical protein
MHDRAAEADRPSKEESMGEKEPENEIRKKPEEKSAPGEGKWRYLYGLWAVLGGLLATFLVFWIAVRYYQDAKSVTNSSNAVAAVLAPVTTVIGTMVGAFFGLQAGQQNAQQAQKQAGEAQKQVAVANNEVAKAQEALKEKSDQVGKLAAAMPDPKLAGSIVGLTPEEVNRAQAQPGS